jgi:glycosyltransferase involved in cell wall biosynthesis
MSFLGRRVPGIGRLDLRSRYVAWSLHRAGVDVVLAEYGTTASSLVRSCGLARVPLVAHFHGHDAYEEEILATYGQRYRDLFRGCAAVIAVSRDMALQLERLGAPPAKIVLNAYGVDGALFFGARPEESPPQFVAVGRFVDKKAPHLTILAFERVLRAVPGARLSMIGDGPLLESCRNLVTALGMDGAVRLMGVRPPADVAEALRGGRCFVQHSLRTTGGDSEGTPVAILEAGATGLPVVSTRHGGIPDVVVDGVTGVLVEERDVDGMGAAMARLAASPSTAARMGHANRERIVAEFSMDQSLSRLREVLQRAISGESPGKVRDQQNRGREPGSSGER